MALCHSDASFPRVEIDRAALLGSDAPASRAQLEHNAAFARASSPPAGVRASSSRPRVLVTAFGRFAGHPINASAGIACALLEKAPKFAPAASDDAPDDPATHVQEMAGTIELPRAGAVDLHVVVLPVMWDLAPMLALFAAARVRPDAILMNGVAAKQCVVGIESHASNLAAVRDDATGRIRPRVEPGAGGPVPILPDVDERRRALSMDTAHVRRAALEAHAMHAATMEGGRRFDAVAPTVEVLSGRDDNVYLCNQVAYLVDRALAHPERTLRLLRTDRNRGDRGIDVAMDPSMARIPRGFVHWPSTLVGTHLGAGAHLLRAMLDAMLARPKDPE